MVQRPSGSCEFIDVTDEKIRVFVIAQQQQVEGNPERECDPRAVATRQRHSKAVVTQDRGRHQADIRGVPPAVKEHGAQRQPSNSAVLTKAAADGVVAAERKWEKKQQKFVGVK